MNVGGCEEKLIKLFGVEIERVYMTDLIHIYIHIYIYTYVHFTLLHPTCKVSIVDIACSSSKFV